MSSNNYRWRFRLHCRLEICVQIAVLLSCCPLLAIADVDIDIRVSGAVNSHHEHVSYIASIADCSDLSSLQVTAGEFQNTFALGGCEGASPDYEY